jgi:hypothetical protein
MKISELLMKPEVLENQESDESFDESSLHSRSDCAISTSSLALSA